MTTLEKIEKVQDLRNQKHGLELEIREEQSKCNHEYPEKPLFDSQSFYARCVKCGHETPVYHRVNIFNGDESDRELQNKWNELILKRKE